MGATGDLLFASIVVSRKESGPSGRDLLIAEPGTEKECPRRLVRTDYRASDPKTPVRIRARALRGEPGITRVLAEIFRDSLVPDGIRRRLRPDPFGSDRPCRRIVPPR